MGEWVSSSAKWEIFKHICELEIDKIDLNEDIEEIDKKFKTTLLEAATQSVSKSKG